MHIYLLLYSQEKQLSNYNEIQDKISNHHQLGGIETSVLDNGKGKGTRIAWINTGSGLRYKIVIDRAMDIADASFNQYNLAWISHLGVVSSANQSFYRNEWLDKFGGGLVTTCGLSHVGPYEEDNSEIRGLLGNITYEPAEIISIIQPNLSDKQPSMSITGLIKESSSFGKHLEMRRTITSILGESSIYIKDEITNRSHTKLPLMLMYHCNFGWPLVDEKSIIHWTGEWQPRSDSNSDRYIFNDKNNFKVCRNPMDGMPHFNGEACAFIDIDEDERHISKTTIINEKLDLAAEITFNKNELPWLTNWQHYKKGEYVIGLEPGTNPPIGAQAAKENNSLTYLIPNETKTYHLKIKIQNSAKDLLIESTHEQNHL